MSTLLTQAACFGAYLSINRPSYVCVNYTQSLTGSDRRPEGLSPIYHLFRSVHACLVA